MEKLILLISTIILFWSCDNQPTLQKYFVEKTESSNFIALDVSPNIINTKKVNLDSSEKAALDSFEKMNILVFKTDSINVIAYQKEILQVKSILKDESYQELMKVGSGNDGAAIYFVGNDDEHIEEFVVFARKKENGFAIIRILGNDMNPTHISNMLRLLQKSQVDMEQLKPLQQLMN